MKVIDSISGYFLPSLQFSAAPKIYAEQLREMFGNAARNGAAYGLSYRYEEYKYTKGAQ